MHLLNNYIDATSTVWPDNFQWTCPNPNAVSKKSHKIQKNAEREQICKDWRFFKEMRQIDRVQTGHFISKILIWTYPFNYLVSELLCMTLFNYKWSNDRILFASRAHFFVLVVIFTKWEGEERNTRPECKRGSQRGEAKSAENSQHLGEVTGVVVEYEHPRFSSSWVTAELTTTTKKNVKCF